MLHYKRRVETIYIFWFA